MNMLLTDWQQRVFVFSIPRFCKYNELLILRFSFICLPCLKSAVALLWSAHSPRTNADSICYQGFCSLKKYYCRPKRVCVFYVDIYWALSVMIATKFPKNNKWAGETANYAFCKQFSVLCIWIYIYFIEKIQCNTAW